MYGYTLPVACISILNTIGTLLASSTKYGSCYNSSRTLGTCSRKTRQHQPQVSKNNCISTTVVSSQPRNFLSGFSTPSFRADKRNTSSRLQRWLWRRGEHVHMPPEAFNCHTQTETRRALGELALRVDGRQGRASPLLQPIQRTPSNFLSDYFLSLVLHLVSRHTEHPTERLDWRKRWKYSKWH